MRLAALYPKAAGAAHENIILYEKGYGKDAAGIAQEAVKFGAFPVATSPCYLCVVCVQMEWVAGRGHYYCCLMSAKLPLPGRAS